MHSSVYNKIKTKCIIPDIPVWSSHETHKEDTIFFFFFATSAFVTRINNTFHVCRDF